MHLCTCYICMRTSCDLKNDYDISKSCEEALIGLCYALLYIRDDPLMNLLAILYRIMPLML
jgi:hypothetical protein